jgi:hypothetical protein
MSDIINDVKSEPYNKLYNKIIKILNVFNDCSFVPYDLERSNIVNYLYTYKVNNIIIYDKIIKLMNYCESECGYHSNNIGVVIMIHYIILNKHSIDDLKLFSSCLSCFFSVNFRNYKNIQHIIHNKDFVDLLSFISKNGVEFNICNILLYYHIRNNNDLDLILRFIDLDDEEIYDELHNKKYSCDSHYDYIINKLCDLYVSNRIDVDKKNTKHYDFNGLFNFLKKNEFICKKFISQYNSTSNIPHDIKLITDIEIKMLCK